MENNKNINTQSWLNPLGWSFSTWFLMGMFCFVFAVTAFGTLVPAMQEILQFKLSRVLGAFLVTLVVPALLSVFLHAFVSKYFSLNGFFRALFIIVALGFSYGLGAAINMLSHYDTLVGRSLLVLDCVSRFNAPRCQERMDTGDRYFSLLLPEAQEVILHNISSINAIPNTALPEESSDGGLETDSPESFSPPQEDPEPTT